MVSSHCGVAGMADMSCSEWSVIGGGAAGAGGGGVVRVGAAGSAARAVCRAGAERGGVEAGIAGKVAGAAGATAACAGVTDVEGAASMGLGFEGSAAGWQAAKTNAATREIVLLIVSTLPLEPSFQADDEAGVISFAASRFDVVGCVPEHAAPFDADVRCDFPAELVA